MSTANINDVLMLHFPELGDDRGRLVVIEGGDGISMQVPFVVKRVFYAYGSDATAVRGKHANRNSEFCLINLCGQSKVKVTDQLGNKKVFVLDKPYIGLYLPAMIWKDMYDFSHNSILLVLSSEYYDESEYIHNFDEYICRNQR